MSTIPINQGAERTKNAVRIVTELYAERADHLLDFLRLVPSDTDRAATTAMACAWRNTSELFSLGFALSIRTELLSVWLDEVSDAKIATKLVDVRQHVSTWSKKWKPFDLSAFHYFSDATRDLRSISFVPFRDIPENEDEAGWSVSPPGFDEFVEAQISVAWRRENEKRIAWDASGFGQLCGWIQRGIEEGHGSDLPERP